MATSTPRLQLRKPAGSDTVNVETDLNENYDKIDTLAVDFYDRGGWYFIDSGEETADFSIDLTAANKYPAGTFRMIKVIMDDVRLDTGNSWVICTVNGLSGATDYSRGWHGESFDGTTTTRNTANDGDRAVLGYVSAQTGGYIEFDVLKTHEISDVPIIGRSRRGAPSGFDGNREWMLTTNVMNTTALADTLDIFVTGTSVISAASWYALGLRLP